MAKYARLRRIAYTIVDKRAYLTFRFDTPRYAFNDHTARGHIPTRLWRNLDWRDKHIVMPVIRQRLKWPSYKLEGNALPDYLRVDNRLF